MQDYTEILIIDDEPETIAFAGNILRREGYSVSAATNAGRAFSFLENHHPDLILLDIKMEDIDGIETCLIIKKNPENADIPVIFLTADNSSDTIRKGFNSGGCDYILKPFVCEEFLARIKAHLKISGNARKLSAANQELKQFCSVVSHDLKSPLNVINMLVSSLDDELGTNKNDSVTEIMNMIQEKTQKLTVMIERLLEFSKMCNIIPEKEVLNIKKISENVMNELRTLEPDRNIILKSEDVPEVYGDPVLIEMLIKNLLSNAVKFTRCREESIVEICSEQNADFTIIKIKDNGAGFDMEYSDKLFQIFQRLHSEDEYEGTGVGLALASRIMERHGGKIEAYGEVDKGAEFRLYFRRKY